MYNYAENYPTGAIDLHGLQKYETTLYDNNLRDATPTQRKSFNKGFVEAGAAIGVELVMEALGIGLFSLVSKGYRAIKGGKVASETIETTTRQVNTEATQQLDLATIEKTANQETAKKILDAPSKRKMPKKVSTIIDEDTGNVYTGVNGRRNLEDLNENVKDLLPETSKEIWPCQQCAEVDALNKAANDGATFGKNLKVYTNQVDKKNNTFKSVNTCRNCDETTRNLDVKSNN